MTVRRVFHGWNAGLAVELYERYRRDPGSLDPASRAFFETWSPADEDPSAHESPAADKIVGTVNLAQSIRQHGHLDARLDPLGGAPRSDPSLKLQAHGLTEDDLEALPSRLVGGPVSESAQTAKEAIDQLRQVYSSKSGFDFEHLRDPKERGWLREAAESGRFRPPRDPIDPRALLDRLTQVEVFEQFLHRTFPGKSRFSIEGLDMLVPILDEAIGAAAEESIHHILIGIAHRGRLNVLAHVLNKPYSQILAEFKDPVRSRDEGDATGWTGDVKYHSGARKAVRGGKQVDLLVSVPPNPSHVEAIDPVVEGMARAAGTDAGSGGAPRYDPRQSLPILVHGDAAFPGQGVVAETLNLSRLPGYRTGGTLHIIANNQLGFTTDPEDAYSSLYASDLAKGFEIPVVHVNADDPEASVEATRIAFDYIREFQKDFVIDLVGYRRHGHNEGDEPAFTQPLMYEKIAEHPTVRKLWADRLEQRGLIDVEGPDGPDALVRARMKELQRILETLVPAESLVEPIAEPPPAGAARQVETGVSVDRMRELNQELLAIPDGFRLHPKLERFREKRRKALEEPGERSIDWATAEELAFATILADGVAVRLTGEDAERGTFSQRHAVLHDAETGREHIPLQALPLAKAAFEIWNSPLSENAALGFEYGYNLQSKDRLVIWEAQYGDFINCGQIVVDEFLCSARAKWGQTPSLVLLLPHGYEGHGPDHSSGRLERFLNLAAGINIRVANATTAAQYFHLLRMQSALLRDDPLPLVVMTPKSLLRHPLARSSPRELAEGRFARVLDDPDTSTEGAPVEEIRRLILCSGKIFVDLVTSEHREARREIAIVRVEQLHPFPELDLLPILDRYPGLAELFWVQEEPENMGAWEYLRPLLEKMIEGRWPLTYIGRPRNASPAEGSLARHSRNQEALVHQAFEPGTKIDEGKVLVLKAGGG
jgi:2-oxoglutarate dehydrogenase E1 component